jgi:hypothetical protein
MSADLDDGPHFDNAFDNTGRYLRGSTEKDAPSSVERPQ